MNSFTDKFISNENNFAFMQDNMMGPNVLRIAEEMALHLDLKENMRILDLGCGCGLSTLFLVQEYGAQVFAADLWITPSENYERFQTIGIADKAIPISADATKGLPFAERYFDVLFSVDAYHYFGDTPEMLPSLVPLVRKGGHIAIAIPGIKYEFGENVPEEMLQWWDDEDIKRTIHSPDWWRGLWNKAEGIEIVDIREMACNEQAWNEWLTSSNPYAVGDVEMMKADNGKYFNTIQMIAKVI
jgi:cyclopropane fatty-acyl-phospholipid synthase-like methyltransferase